MNEYTTHQTGALLKNGEPITMAECIDELNNAERMRATLRRLDAIVTHCNQRLTGTEKHRAGVIAAETMLEVFDVLTHHRDHIEGDA